LNLVGIDPLPTILDIGEYPITIGALYICPAILKYIQAQSSMLT
jgi:hypothetical protein